MTDYIRGGEYDGMTLDEAFSKALETLRTQAAEIERLEKERDGAIMQNVKIDGFRELELALKQDAVMRLEIAEAQVASLTEELRDRDELWCRALACLSTNEIERVTVLFNNMRPDAAPSFPGRERE